MIEIDDLYVCCFLSADSFNALLLFFSSTTFDRSDVIRATFEMSGRAKHNTFAARIGASGDCCNTYKNAIINTSFLIMFRGNVAEMVLLLCVSPGK